jgi:hypothetical protein
MPRDLGGAKDGAERGFATGQGELQFDHGRAAGGHFLEPQFAAWIIESPLDAFDFWQ